MSNIANEWCAATETVAIAKPARARPTRELVFMRASTALLNRRSFLDCLLRRHHPPLLDRIAGVAPLFQRITHRRALRADRRCALEVQTVDVRLLIDLRVLPRVNDREPLAVWRQLEPLDETGLRRPNPSSGNSSIRKSGCFHNQRASFVAADRMPCGCRSSVAQIRMPAAV